MRLARLLAKARHDERGTAAIEFAAIASFLVVIFLGVTDVSRLAMASMRVRYAAEAGATYAVNNASRIADTATRSAALTEIVNAAVAATSLTKAQSGEDIASNEGKLWTPTPLVKAGCASASGITFFDAPGTSPSTNPAPTTCNAYGSSLAPGLYVVVQPSMRYHALFQPSFIVYPDKVSQTLQVRVK